MTTASERSRGTEPYFDRGVTDRIKGALIALMFFHHTFTFPAWIVSGAGYPFLASLTPELSRATRICVGAFAFLSGMLACWQPRRGVKAGIVRDLRRATDFLLSYWAVYALLLLFAKLAGRAVLDPIRILYDLFGLRQDIMTFNWYVPFFLLSLPCLRLLSGAMDRGPLVGVFCGIFLPCGVFTVLASLCGAGGARGGEFFTALSHVFENARDCFPALACGYLCARHNVFGRIFERELTGGLRSAAAKKALCAALLVLCCAGRYVFPAAEWKTGEIFGRSWTFRLSMDAVLAPLFVWGLAVLFKSGTASRADPSDVRAGPVSRALGAVFGAMGKLSMLMWFFSCAFFNVCRDLTQPVLYAPRFAPLVFAWGLALCFAASFLTDLWLKKLLALKNRLLFPSSLPTPAGISSGGRGSRNDGADPGKTGSGEGG